MEYIWTLWSRPKEEEHLGKQQQMKDGRPTIRWGNTKRCGFVVGETGASCYNFHSNSIFHKNMQARGFCWTWSCNITSLLSQNTSHFILHHVTKKLSEISHEPSTVTTSPIYGVSCYSMRGKVLQRNVLPLFVLRSHILCPVVMYLVVDFQYGFWHSWTNHN